MDNTSKAKKVNYSQEDTERLAAMYEELGNEGLETIAETLNKSIRSVRGKLVREGLYVAPEKGAPKAKDGPTKKELLNDLEAVAPFPVDGLMGATKEAIANLIQAFTSKDAE